VGWPLLSDARGLTAAVAVWQSSEDGELAVLTLGQPGPPGSAVAGLGRLPSAPGTPLLAFGLSAESPVTGAWLRLRLVGSLDGGLLQVELETGALPVGFGGGPVFDRRTGDVVGVFAESGTLGSDHPATSGRRTSFSVRPVAGSVSWARLASPVIADGPLPRPMIFLSYAGEDTAAAVTVRDALRAGNFRIYDRQERDGTPSVADIEENLLDASVFVALVSPSYLASPWCRRERELALLRDASTPDAVFAIRALRVEAVPDRELGFLGEFGLLEMADLPDLVDSLAVLGATGRADSSTVGGRRLSFFRNRENELATVHQDIANPAGQQLWLVVSPPGFGKTWFMNQVARRVIESGDPWTVRLVDLRHSSREQRGDPGLLLAHLLGETVPIDGRAGELAAAAIRIGRRPHLCLLDSADLLDPEVAAALQARLMAVYKYVRDDRGGGVRLALIVGSRRADSWPGIDPRGRLERLQLAEFPLPVIAEALRDLSGELGGAELDSEALGEYAEWVQRQTEGVPALLTRCLWWIRNNGFLPRELLPHSDLFREVTIPFLRGQFLSEASLFPGSDKTDPERRQVLDEAFRVLSSYRLFTQSHLRHHLRRDVRLRAGLEALGWAESDLYLAIEGTALLLQNNEIWHQIHPAVRRLLHRYYYPTEEAQLEAHRRARDFVEDWAAKLAGPDQLIGFTECLWHEAAVLRITSPGELTERLCRSAEALGGSVLDEMFSRSELRRALANRIARDDELAALVGDGIGELIATVLGQRGGP
jgi:hypothetical protein